MNVPIHVEDIRVRQQVQVKAYDDKWDGMG